MCDSFGENLGVRFPWCFHGCGFGESGLHGVSMLGALGGQLWIRIRTFSPFVWYLSLEFQNCIVFSACATFVAALVKSLGSCFHCVFNLCSICDRPAWSQISMVFPWLWHLWQAWWTAWGQISLVFSTCAAFGGKFGGQLGSRFQSCFHGCRSWLATHHL